MDYKIKICIKKTTTTTKNKTIDSAKIFYIAFEGKQKKKK